MFKEYFRGIYEYRFVLISLVAKDLQSKYRHSFLGVLWSVITPLSLVVIIGSVYSIIFGANPRIFIPTLFAGITPWAFLNSSAEAGATAYLSAEGYLKQTQVSPQIFPLRVVLGGLVNLLYSSIAFFGVYVFLNPQAFNIKMLLFFPGLAMVFMFSLGMSNVTSILNLIIRDFQPLQGIIFQGLFYVTPVIFTSDMLKEKGFEILYKINPFYYILEVIKRPMLGEVPELEVYIIAFMISLTTFILSIILTMKENKKIVLRL